MPFSPSLVLPCGIRSTPRRLEKPVLNPSCTLNFEGVLGSIYTSFSVTMFLGILAISSFASDSCDCQSRKYLVLRLSVLLSFRVALAAGLRESHLENAEGGTCGCRVYL